MVDAASAIIGPGVAAEAAGPATVGPDAVPVTLIVNGVARTLAVEPRTTLAEALRGSLGLTGTKVACDRGSCAACTVWLDGIPVCSCMALAIEIGGRRITTIEGLAQGEALHPVQVAFIEHDALQRGFCTPGIVMSCAALLDSKSDPTAEEVRAAISGHQCRCGTYPHVVLAALAVVRTHAGRAHGVSEAGREGLLPLAARRRCRSARPVGRWDVPKRRHRARCGGAGAAPAKAAEKRLVGRRIDEGAAREAARVALDDATPFSGNVHKLPLFETVVRRGILAAAADR